MALTIHKIKSPGNVHWAWPLKLGLPKNAPALKKKLLAGHWPKFFTKIEAIRNKQHYNIIFFDGISSFQQYNLRTTSTADTILIFLKPGEQAPLQPDAKATQSLKAFNANGIFIFHAANISTWFSQFVEELSHNLNMVDALQRTTTDGSCWYDPKLEAQASLLYVKRRLVNIFKSNSNVKFRIRSRLTNESSLSGMQIAKLITKNLTSFDSEGYSATDLNEISTSTFAGKPQIFKKIVTGKGTAGTRGGIKTPPALPGHPIKKGKKAAKKAAPKKAAPRKAVAKKIARKVTKKPHITKARLPVESDLLGNVADTKPEIKPTEAEQTLRYLQANIKTNNDKPVKDYLKPSTAYKIEVRIGEKDKDFVDSGEIVDTKAIFKDSKKKKEPIQIKFVSNLDKKATIKTISLPRQGNSNAVIFPIKTNSILKKFEGEIYAYHKNRLIQHVQLTAVIGKNVKSKSTVKMLPVFSAKKNLDNIGSSTQFTSSLQYKTGAKKSSSINGMNKNKPVDIFSENGLKGHLDDMKKAIENALIDPKEKNYARLTARGNQELFLFLARKGNLISTNYLHGSVAPDGPLQIITNYQEYAPLEFIYSFAAPADDATLCPNAVAALKEGKCKECFDLKKEPASHICPFGFWSFSRVLERHSVQLKHNNSKADYSVVSEPTATRNLLNVLQNSIYASAEKVEVTATKGLRKQIAAAIKKNSKKLFEADDWKKWTAEMQANKPDTLFLIVHIEKDRFNIDNIQIGTNFLAQNFFKTQLIVHEDLTPPPFIVIIGCEAINLAASGFDVSAQLMNSGAAIVLSNFTKIRGRQAKDIILKLVEFLKQGGKKEILLGEVMLKLRQFLLSEGLVAGLSLVAQGDADWKIKT